MAPRAWQTGFLAQHARAAGRDFLLVATPGSGKTLAACLVELAKLVACYPDEAERLRIAASVEAIDGSLAAATAGR